MNIAIDDKPLRFRRVKELVQMSRSWIYREISLGHFPAPAYKFGKNSVAWSQREVMAWLDAHRI